MTRVPDRGAGAFAVLVEHAPKKTHPLGWVVRDDGRFKGSVVAYTDCVVCSAGLPRFSTAYDGCGYAGSWRLSLGFAYIQYRGASADRKRRHDGGPGSGSPYLKKTSLLCSLAKLTNMDSSAVRLLSVKKPNPRWEFMDTRRPERLEVPLSTCAVCQEFAPSDTYIQIGLKLRRDWSLDTEPSTIPKESNCSMRADSVIDLGV